jgi:hypothetical protein
MGELLQRTVYELTSLLLWPDIVLLLISVGHAFFLAGEALVEGLRRGRTVRHLTDPSAPPPGMGRRYGIAEWGRQAAADPGASPWLLLDRTEATLVRRVDRARLWVRLGPALGLAGTLIPLGPALLGLAANDLEALSAGLIIAFGTTVLGSSRAGSASSS